MQPKLDKNKSKFKLSMNWNIKHPTLSWHLTVTNSYIKITFAMTNYSFRSYGTANIQLCIENGWKPDQYLLWLGGNVESHAAYQVKHKGIVVFAYVSCKLFLHILASFQNLAFKNFMLFDAFSSVYVDSFLIFVDSSSNGKSCCNPSLSKGHYVQTMYCNHF